MVLLIRKLICQTKQSDFESASVVHPPPPEISALAVNPCSRPTSLQTADDSANEMCFNNTSKYNSYSE